MLPNLKTAKILFITACVFFTSAAYGADFNYVDPASISPEFIVPPPAVNGALYNNEVDEIIKTQATVTQSDIAAADAEKHLKPKDMDFEQDIKHKDFPQTYALLEKVKADCDATVDNAKNYWHYTRPYLADPRIKALVEPAKNYSYPSGHTTCSRVWAEVLGQLAPQKRQQFRARAADIAQHRVLAGMHWPHDLAGGEQLALLFFGALQASDSYKSDLNAAKSEWR